MIMYISLHAMTYVIYILPSTPKITSLFLDFTKL